MQRILDPCISVALCRGRQFAQRPRSSHQFQKRHNRISLISQFRSYISSTSSDGSSPSPSSSSSSGLSKEDLRQRRWYRRFMKASRQKMQDEIDEIRKFSLRKWIAIIGGVVAALGALEVLWSNITETEAFQRRRAVRLLKATKWMLPMSETAQRSVVFRADLVQQLRDLRRPNQPDLSSKVAIICGDNGCGKTTLIQSAFHRQSGIIHVDLLESMSISAIASEVLRQMRFSHEPIYANPVNYLKSVLYDIPEVDMYTASQRLSHLLRSSPTKFIRRLGVSLGGIPFSLDDPLPDYGKVKPMIILNISPTTSAASEMLLNAVKLARTMHEAGIASVAIECSDSVAIAKLLDGSSKQEHQDRINLIWVNPIDASGKRAFADTKPSVSPRRVASHTRAITERLQGPPLPFPINKKGYVAPAHPYKELIKQLISGPVPLDKAAIGVMQRIDAIDQQEKDDPWVRDVISFVSQRLGIHGDAEKKSPFAVGNKPRLAQIRYEILSDLVRHDGVVSYRPDTGELRLVDEAALQAAVMCVTSKPK